MSSRRDGTLRPTTVRAKLTTPEDRPDPDMAGNDFAKRNYLILFSSGRRYSNHRTVSVGNEDREFLRCEEGC
jgi:hypothetical protein